MADLKAIAATLRRQRKDMEELMDSTSTRSGETAALLTKIEELRQRAAKAQQLVAPPKTPR